MDWPGSLTGRFSPLLALWVLAVSGCAAWRLPAIDPSGARFLLPSPAYTTGAVPFGGVAGLPRPAYTVPPPPPRCSEPLPIAPDPAAYPPSLAAAGQPIYTDPRTSAPQAGVGLSLSPTRVIAPVGSEVVLMVGLGGPNGRWLTGQLVEWILDQKSVGHFVQVGGEDRSFWRTKLSSAPRKLSGDYALGRTSTSYQLLTRGTPSRQDDLWLPRGRTWISVLSAAEGTSHVTAFAPKVEGWDRRQQTAIIHWIDSQWSFPTPAIVAAGQPHVLTTTLSRHTSGAPVSGWLVRYEILEDFSAGFAPGGSRVVEVATDPSGKASVQIVPQTAEPGIARFSVQVIRPPTATSDLPRLVVGQGWSSVNWSAPGLAIRATGPEMASAGTTVTYRIEISNPGDQTAADVVVSDTLPDGLAYLNSTPTGQVRDSRLEWRIGNLAGRDVRVIEINCRAEQQGPARHCVTAQSSGGLTAQHCVTTSVFVPALTVQISGPERAEVGQEVSFRIAVANQSDASLSGVIVTDKFDAGFEHSQSASPLERPLGELGPGETRDLAITFTVTQPGVLCHGLEITADGSQTATAWACLTATEPARRAEPAMSVRKTGPDSRKVGEVAQFDIEVTNTGDVPLVNLKIIDQYGDSLQMLRATEEATASEGRLVWTIDKLMPGATETRQIECKCITPDSNACNMATVTSDQLPSRDSQACLEILPADEPDADQPSGDDPGQEPGEGKSPPSGGLLMSVVDQDDPINVGQTTTYLIQIKNDRENSDKQVALKLVLPTEVKFEKLEGPTGIQSAGPNGRTIQVRAIAELRPGESVTYRVTVTASGPGQVRLSVELNSLREPAALTEQEDTTILVE